MRLFRFDADGQLVQDRSICAFISIKISNIRSSCSEVGNSDGASIIFATITLKIYIIKLHLYLIGGPGIFHGIKGAFNANGMHKKTKRRSSENGVLLTNIITD